MLVIEFSKVGRVCIGLARRLLCTRAQFGFNYLGLKCIGGRDSGKTFVVSRFSDIQKETTSLLVVPKRNNQERCSFSIVSENTRPGMTRNDQKRSNFWLKVGVGVRG